MPGSASDGLWARHLGPSLKFLTVGGLVFLFDAVLYNLLVFWSPASGWGHGLLHAHPISAKVLTIVAASSLTYLGNRLWTYRDRPSPRTARSILVFVGLNVLASALQLACLGFSRYVLGLDSALADNVSGTLVGQVVSTTFRYLTYGRFVFPHDQETAPDDADIASDERTGSLQDR
ncbi:GtrA family protein [Brachybacterium sp. ACRRE]|uniref:GtrA family protein n=1 Tax=Brachybacterium sp. ACRRE TaxID=2918184 RepID=UPI001EF2EF74|nr:GtrA family protein [Brachybacterium sp. ACRRE]